MRRAGEGGVFRGGSWRSRSAGRGGGALAWRPIPQTAQQTSPGQGGGSRGGKQVKEVVLGMR